MTPTVSEEAFEDAIECALLAGGPDACPGISPVVREAGAIYGEGASGGYLRRSSEDYDRARCLIPADLVAFVQATQPRSWTQLSDHYGERTREQFLSRVAREVGKRGTLDVLRKGIKDRGVRFELAFFRPSSGLNAELGRLYEGNLFSVVRQLHYSESETRDSLDIGVFLNGLPIFTAELKTPLTGQDVTDAVRQYRHDRSPHEPLFAYRRCLAHFAVDPDQVQVATRLAGPGTRFLPFNRGRDGGAGNPPVPPTENRYATAYLWERVWARDSVLNLVRHFIHEVAVEDDEGRATGDRALIFPRYHQLDAVRGLVEDARRQGAGRRYLIQHSAGSGKSNSIAWLAHQLSVLHDEGDARVFDSIVVITDRRVLDRQLQRTIRQFQQVDGVVENIDRTSRQLRAALEQGKTIIVTTLQKFPVISAEMGELAGKRFAVIIDEAHSSQSGEAKKHLHQTLAVDDLEAAEAADEVESEDTEDRVVREMKTRGPMPNASTFAFTATPKPKTLELFGTKQPDGSFVPFSLYAMRQAIEEGFILDVLENYTTWRTYWKLQKTVADDPRYERNKAAYLMKQFADLHEHAVGEKVQVIVEHFEDQIAHRIGGRAKAMVVTRSRLHAVRYARALRDYIARKGYRHGVLVAFSGTVNDGGVAFTESGMNELPETQTTRAFHGAAHRFLVVANKFQTGFDEPLLHTMYVDKRLGGVNAVQTLSRLNRTHPDKEECVVLDFANDAGDIQAAFEPYYERTILSEETDPNLLYDFQTRIEEFHLFTTDDVDGFADIAFDPDGTQEQLYAALAPVRGRFAERGAEEQEDFRGALRRFVRLYAFLGQILTFTDPELEKLYVFARHLARYLPSPRVELPREVQEKIDLGSFQLKKDFSGSISLARGGPPLAPRTAPEGSKAAADPDEGPLSEIIRTLNERFGANLTEKDRVTIENLQEQLVDDPALVASLRANTRENARLTFDHIASDRLQEIVDSNFRLYKRISDDKEFGRMLLEFLFEEALRRTKGGGSSGSGS
ncbi:MAG: DEAD/DEAH box helicase family protein [Longimicrobiales bacterium]|nr:DEAD/DEAH box helicase family protein [Longimicrobiales bacterium]